MELVQDWSQSSLVLRFPEQLIKIVSGREQPTKNPKTGSMVQTCCSAEEQGGVSLSFSYLCVCYQSVHSLSACTQFFWQDCSLSSSDSLWSFFFPVTQINALKSWGIHCQLEDETVWPTNQASNLNLEEMNLSSEHGMDLFTRLDTITIKKEVKYF